MKAIEGHRYRHFKGKEYIVLHIAHDSETLEDMIVYRAKYNSPEFGENAVWVRPRTMFEEKIEREGKLLERFTDIS